MSFELENIAHYAGEWLRGQGPLNEIVVSSRIRLARNLAGFWFVNRADAVQHNEVLNRCKTAITQQLGDEVIWVDLNQSTPLDKQILVERHLISSQHAHAKKNMPRAVAIGPSETFAIMVNEEDHLRIQVLRSGLQLNEAFEQINRIDDALEDQLSFAFSRQFGYLTACPTNIGTGIRVSVMLHLPALKLTNEIDKVKRAAKELHLAVRGLFGEGSEAFGDLYQISNQVTLGKSEQEILADFQHAVLPQIIAYEQQARQALLHDCPTQLEDKIWRAWGTLTHARLLDAEEVLNLLSHLRLGMNVGKINSVDARTINELFLLSQPGHLQKIMGKELGQVAQSEERAKLIRQKLAGA